MKQFFKLVAAEIFVTNLFRFIFLMSFFFPTTSAFSQDPPPVQSGEFRSGPKPSGGQLPAETRVDQLKRGCSIHQRTTNLALISSTERVFNAAKKAADEVCGSAHETSMFSGQAANEAAVERNGRSCFDLKLREQEEYQNYMAAILRHNRCTYN